jgi:hypothetical protein
VAAGAAWVLRRRTLFAGLDEDLSRILSGLHTKAAAARRLASTQRRSSREIKRRIHELQSGAVELCRRLRTIGQSLAMVDSDRTLAEIEALERRLVSATESTTRHELTSALEQKRKAVAAADDLRTAEERCRLRLSKIEGVIDSTCLQLQRADAGRDAGPIEDSLLRELDSEVRAIGEIAREAEEEAYLQVR